MDPQHLNSERLALRISPVLLARLDAFCQREAQRTGTLPDKSTMIRDLLDEGLSLRENPPLDSVEQIRLEFQQAFRAFKDEVSSLLAGLGEHKFTGAELNAWRDSQGLSWDVVANQLDAKTGTARSWARKERRNSPIPDEYQPAIQRLMSSSPEVQAQTLGSLFDNTGPKAETP